MVIGRYWLGNVRDYIQYDLYGIAIVVDSSDPQLGSYYACWFKKWRPPGRTPFTVDHGEVGLSELGDYSGGCIASW